MRPRIVFYAGNTLEEVGPPVLNEKGIGGSETALIEVARRFEQDGWRVDVFVHAGRYEGEHDGVGYWEPGRLRGVEECDVLVSWRQPPAHTLPVRARSRVVWLHDHNHGPGAADDLRRWDRVLGVSSYHAGFLSGAYNLTTVSFVPNGIDLARFDPPIRKVGGRCVYASSPDRGLVTLLKLWPEIKGDEGRPELHVAYGWHNFDKWIQAGRNDMQAFKDEAIALMAKTPGVVWRDRLPQDELARLYSESVAWLYPSDFLEVSCISAMEAMAGGCVPIVSSAGALKETVGEGGLVVWGPGKTRSNPYSPSWREFYVRCAQGVLFETNTRKFLELKARERAKAFSWDAAYENHWKPIVEGLLAGEKPTEQKELVAA